MNDPYKAYQKSSDNQMSGLSIIVELYAGIIKFLEEGKQAALDNKNDIMLDKIERARKVIEALEAHLDMENGGEDAKFLLEFYHTLRGRFMLIWERDDRPREFQQLIHYVRPVYQRWQKMAAGEPIVPGETESAVQEAKKQFTEETIKIDQST